MATKDEMHEASEEAIEQLKEIMKQDEQFKTQMLVFAKWLKSWYLKAGYKQICRFLISLVK